MKNFGSVFLLFAQQLKAARDSVSSAEANHHLELDIPFDFKGPNQGVYPNDFLERAPARYADLLIKEIEKSGLTLNSIGTSIHRSTFLIFSQNYPLLFKDQGDFIKRFIFDAIGLTQRIVMLLKKHFVNSSQLELSLIWVTLLYADQMLKVVEDKRWQKALPVTIAPVDNTAKSRHVNMALNMKLVSPKA